FAVVAPGVEIPAALEEIIQRGLKKSPSDRIGSADDYLAMLDGLSPPLRPMPRLSTTPPRGELRDGGSQRIPGPAGLAPERREPARAMIGDSGAARSPAAAATTLPPQSATSPGNDATIPPPASVAAPAIGPPPPATLARTAAPIASVAASPSRALPSL